MNSREAKHFFVDNNYLNKIAPNQDSTYGQKIKKEFEELMPPPEVLQAYEEIMPGTVEKLLSLMEEEQKHKHAMEKAKVFMHSKTEMIGKLFASFTVIIIAYTTIILAKQSIIHSLVFAAISFVSIFAVSIITNFKLNKTQISKSHLNKPIYKNKKIQAENLDSPKDSKTNWHKDSNRPKRSINKKTR